jgi:hypothetical protein
MIGNSNRHIYLGGYDVTRYVLNTKVPTAMQFKPEWGELPAISRLEFDLLNDTGIFSSKGLKSVFNNIDLTSITAKVTLEQGSTVTTEWDGVVENILEDHRTRRTTVTGITQFSKLLDSPSLVTLGANTPSELSRLVFGLYNIPVDEIAYAKANSLLSGLVLAQVDPNLLDSHLTLMELQKQLAAAGYARIYSINGLMVYEVFDVEATQAPGFSITERQIMEHPVITKETRLPTAYTVETLFGRTESPDWQTGSNSKNLDFGPNAAVKITSLSAGQQVATQWAVIDRLQTSRIEFAVLDDIGLMFDLNTFINFTCEPIAIINATMEIIGIDRSDHRYTKLTGRVAS